MYVRIQRFFKSRPRQGRNSILLIPYVILLYELKMKNDESLFYLKTQVDVLEYELVLEYSY